MKIYFAGSIRGGREDRAIYLTMVNHLQTFGTVLTEHVGDAELTERGEGEDGDKTDDWIYDRDMDWLKLSDVLVAEVTTPSLGVGYELGQAEAMGKTILCLNRTRPGKRLSAMISGNKNLTVAEYNTMDEAKAVISDFLSAL